MISFWSFLSGSVNPVKHWNRHQKLTKIAKMAKKAKVATSALYVEVRFRRPRYILSADMYSVTDVLLSICAGMANVLWLDYPLTLDSLFVFSSNKTMKYVLDAITSSGIAFGKQKLNRTFDTVVIK